MMGPLKPCCSRPRQAPRRDSSKPTPFYLTGVVYNTAACVYGYVYMYTHAYIHTHVYVCMYAYMHACMYAVDIHMYICLDIRVYIYIHT